jgi:hypothetical protein
MGGHVACTKEMRKVSLVGKPEEKRQLGILDYYHDLEYY